MRNRTTAAAVALVAGLGANAAETHGAHEHGHAVLKLVLEGSAVVVSFEGPLDSIVGFEHEPKNDKQRAALKEAMQIVQAPENIVRLPAGCTASGESEVDVPYVDDDHDAEHADHDDHADHDRDADHDHDADHADHDDHDAEHADHDADHDHAEAGHDHESGEDHGDEEGEVHADLEVTFRYRCESGPEWLEATAFATFDGLEEVELQAVGPDNAVVETLTAASPRAVLAGLRTP